MKSEKESAFTVIKELQKSGYQAYLVGGCVRDLVLGKTPKDYDVTTDATPDQVMSLFEKTLTVGASFGVVIVVDEGNQIEVATFRADGEYGDNRRPNTVTYSKTAKEDVARRDFTMNGLVCNFGEFGEVEEEEFCYTVYDGTTLHIKDYVNGINDIENQVIRCIGDPDTRFHEDALRMLRAVRFAAQLGFEIEYLTELAITKNAHLLANVSRERVAAELQKIVSSPFPLKGLVPLFSTNLMEYAIPNYHSSFNLLRRFGNYSTSDPLMGMSMLFADVSHYRSTEMYVRDLKMSNEQCEIIVNAVENQQLEGNDVEKKKAARKPGVLDYAVKLAIQNESLFCRDYNYRDRINFYTNLSKEDINPQVFITGKDLIERGLTPGPLFSKIIQAVEDGQLEGIIKTKEEANVVVANIVMSAILE